MPSIDDYSMYGGISLQIKEISICAVQGGGTEIIMNYNAFLSTLPIMAKGMAGIFIVTAVIIVSVYILNKISEQSDK